MKLGAAFLLVLLSMASTVLAIGPRPNAAVVPDAGPVNPGVEPETIDPDSPRAIYRNPIGQHKLLVLRVVFSSGTEGTSFLRTRQEFIDAFFADTPGAISVARWLRENSVGATTLIGDVSTNVYTLPNSMAYYGYIKKDAGYVGSALTDALVTDALQAANNDYLFGLYDHILVLHAGYDESRQILGPTDTNAAVVNRIWAVFKSGKFSTVGNPQQDYAGIGIVSEDPPSPFPMQIPTGTYVHELLHSMGAPDLYDVDGGDTKMNQPVGAWSIMGQGSWLFKEDGAFLPVSADPIVRKFMNWGPTPVQLSTNGNYSILPIHSTTAGNKIYQVNIPGSSETLLLEYRLLDFDSTGTFSAGTSTINTEWDFGIFKQGFHRGVDGVLDVTHSGLLIWHLDNNLFTNEEARRNDKFNAGLSFILYKHPGAAVQAPGLGRTSSTFLGEYPYAFDPSDKFRATFSADVGYTACTPDTRANTNDWVNNDSGLFITHISKVPTGPSGTSLLSNPMTFSFGVRTQTGFPFATGSGVNASSPQLGDIDGDGIPEILMVANNKVWAINGDGTTKATFTLDGNSANIRTTPAVVDLDGDDILDVVVAGFQNVYALKFTPPASFTTLWQHNYCTAIGTASSSPAVADIDGDGLPEIFVGSRSGCMYGWHRDGSQIVFPASPCDLAFAATTTAPVTAISSTPAIADLDGDGQKEIIATVASSSVPDVYVWRSNGTNYVGWPKNLALTITASPAVANLDGIGNKEIVIASQRGVNDIIRAYHDDGSILWTFNSTAKITSSPAIGDVDQDGVLDVVYGDLSFNIHSLNGATGTENPGFPYLTNNFVSSSAALADLDDDERPDILIGSSDSKLYALAAKPGTGGSCCTVNWIGGYSDIATLDGIVNSSPAVGPTDNENTLDFVVGTNASAGSIFVRDWCVNFNVTPAKFPWTSFHHDRRNTGDYTADTIAPPAPTNVNVRNVGDGTSMKMTWARPTGNNATDTAGYTVYWATTATPPVILGSKDASNALQEKITGLTPATTYNFAVTARDNALPKNVSGKTPWQTATPVVSSYFGATTVSGLGAVNVGDGTSLQVSYTPPGGGAAGYIVEWDTASNPTNYQFAVDAGNVTTHRITGLTTGTLYYINVVPYDASNSLGGATTEVSATPANTIPPDAPKGVSLSNVGNGTQIRVYWLANTEEDLTAYKVYYGTTSGGPYTSIPAGNVTTYTVGGLTPGTIYYVAVSATDTASLESQKSVEASMTADALPGAPRPLVVNPQGEGCEVWVNWYTNREDDLAGYRILWGTASSTYTNTLDVGNTTGGKITGLTTGTTYYVAVRAYDSGTNLSPYSIEATTVAKDIIAPANVANTVVASKNAGNLGLAWNAVTLNVNGSPCENVTLYRVYRGTTPNFTIGTPLGTSPGTAYTDVGAITAGTDYYYLISAVDASGNEGTQH